MTLAAGHGQRGKRLEEQCVIHLSEHLPEFRERMKVRLGKGAAFTAARYGLAVVANAFVTQLTLGVPFMREMPFVLFFAVTIVSALYGGIGPGLLAIVLSAFLVAFCFMPPYFELSFNGNPEQVLQVALYVIVAGMSCAFLAGWKRKVLHFQGEEAKYRSLTETTPEGVLMFDEQERILYANEAGRRMFGEGAEELIGSQLEAIVPRDVYGAILEALRRRIDSRLQEKAVRFISERRKGNPLCLDLTLQIFSQDGRAMFAAWFHKVEPAG